MWGRLALIAVIVAVAAGGANGQAPAPTNTAAPAPAPDDDATEALRLERLRDGLPSEPGRRVNLALPRQMGTRDVEYWAWVLALPPERLAHLRTAVAQWQPLDDEARRMAFPKLFDAAGDAARPSGELSVADAKAFASRLRRDRAEVLASLRRSERLALAGVAPDPEDPDRDALVAALSTLRDCDEDRGFRDTLESTRIDAPRLLWLFCMRSDLDPKTTEPVRQCCADAMPSLAELRQAHARAFANRLEREVFLSLVVHEGSKLPNPPTIDDWKQWHSERERARTQLMHAARRIAEAEHALIENAAACLPSPQGDDLMHAYATAAYGSLALDAWDATRMLPRLAKACAWSPPEEFGQNVTEFASASRIGLRDLQRAADLYWQGALTDTKEDVSRWRTAEKRLRDLRAAAEARAELLIAEIVARLPPECGATAERLVEEFRDEARGIERKQIERLNPKLANRGVE